MKIKYLAITILSFLFVFAACKQKDRPENKQEQKEQSVNHLDWTRNAVIYEVNVRQYTPEGTFKAFEKYLPQLKELGVDVLWFMPVHPISEKNRKGELGSYYAVKDYKAINPEFGTAEDFKQLVTTAQGMGFKVILDWVANHTGCDNIWVEQHPDWYVKDSLGNIKSPYDWTDTYELNYDNKDMRAAMTDAMKYWVENYNIDGFRCDMAHEVPTDFWNDARAQLDSVKPMFMLAESENYDLLEKAFDANYSWELMHMMSDINKGTKDADSIYAYLNRLDTIMVADGYKMNFLTNHDENSWNGTEYERYGKGVEAFAVLTYTINGMPMIYTGQEVGLKKRLEFFTKDQVPSWTKNSTFEFYQKLNNLKHSSPALLAGVEGGKLKRYTTSDKNIMVYSRTKDAKEVLVFLNLSDKESDVKILDELPKGEYINYFTGETVNSIQPDIKMKAWEYLVLVK